MRDIFLLTVVWRSSSQSISTFADPQKLQMPLLKKELAKLLTNLPLIFWERYGWICSSIIMFRNYSLLKQHYEKSKSKN